MPRWSSTNSRAVPLVPVDEAVERARDTAAAARDANQFDLATRILRLAIGTEPPARSGPRSNWS